MKACATCGAMVHPRYFDLHNAWHRQQMTVPVLEWGIEWPDGIRVAASEATARGMLKLYGGKLYCRIPGNDWTEVKP